MLVQKMICRWERGNRKRYLCTFLGHKREVSIAGSLNDVVEIKCERCGDSIVFDSCGRMPNLTIDMGEVNEKEVID